MSGQKPNIVFILADDLGEWALGCSGNSDIKTPIIDSLANNGVRFTNFFCTSPVCSPARASLMTGTIPSQHGVHDWLRGGNINIEDFPSLKENPVFASENKAIRYLDSQTCYTDLLAQAGYSCALSGKWHLGDSIHPQHGFSNWFSIARGGCDYYHADITSNEQIYYGNKYITDLITDDAIKNLNQLANQSSPFYISVHYTAPHSPWTAENHPKEYLDMYKDCSFSATPDLPLHPWQDMNAPCGTGEKRRELLSGYYAAISAMDTNIGRILKTIEDKKIADNTIVIFTSDNGMNMGHHGIWGKGNATFPQNMFDTSIKVPFIVSCPPRFKPKSICSNFISQYDFLPTIADYLNIDISSLTNLPGKSFASVLRGQPCIQDDDIVVYDEYGPVRMIRSRGWKLVRRYPYGPNELYHIEVDLNEEKNLYGNPEYDGITQDLMARLEKWFAKYVNPNIDGAKEPVTGKGQLCRVGSFSNGKPCYAELNKFWRSR